MSHSLAELRSRNPMWYFERNYAALMSLVDDLRLHEKGISDYVFQGTQITINLLEQTRYTYLLEIRQTFPQSGIAIPDLEFRVRVYLDARLAEVVGYQGKHYLKARYPVPNISMFHPDEKRQSNLLLYDWLMSYGFTSLQQAGSARYFA
jgi:uncharacterized protein YqiB (DUF1249 family)